MLGGRPASGRRVHLPHARWPPCARPHSCCTLSPPHPPGLASPTRWRRWCRSWRSGLRWVGAEAIGAELAKAVGVGHLKWRRGRSGRWLGGRALHPQLFAPAPNRRTRFAQPTNGRRWRALRWTRTACRTWGRLGRRRACVTRCRWAAGGAAAALAAALMLLCCLRRCCPRELSCSPCASPFACPLLGRAQLMTPAAVLARTNGREAIARGDVEEAHTLFR